ncbi:dihydrolipoyl dehydrogenase [Buchnera aphidicola (Ceratoglyphina bambusae)]|uniref:dihydrolipoyl dehydrogenase n=1 Tax=Buchnera aphidicola TaxID=9 RepID=UPI0031B8792C
MTKDLYTNTVVIGSGPSGYSAAFRLADLGINTVLIDKKNVLGGVCLNNGCIPSKYLLHIAKVIKEVKKLNNFGLKIDVKKINILNIILEKNKIIKKLNNGLKSIAKSKNIKILNGSAYFNDKNSILLNLNNTNDKIKIFFKNAIISSGSKAIKLQDIPYDNPRIWNSTDALNFIKVPKKMLIIGSGIIGMEMATVYSALGSKVDIVERSSKFFSFLDSDITKIFKNSFKDDFNILLGTKIVKIIEKKEGILVNLNNFNGFNENILYDVILIAVGRKPNVKNLKLNNVGINLNKFGSIKVDEKLRTNIKNIYAIGDVTGNPMLAHKGSYQGKIVAEIIYGKNIYYDPKVIPYIIYSYPELAWTGILEKEALEKKLNYKVAKFPWSFSGRALSSNNNLGITKLIFNLDTNRIIGGIVVGSGAGELLGEISLAIEMCCDAEDISLTMHAHPTLYETICLSSEIFQKKCVDII